MNPLPRELPATLDRLATVLGGWTAGAIEAFVPVSCAVCEHPGRSLCRGCHLLLRRSTARPALIRPPRGLHDAGVPVWAGGAYEHELAACILAYKNGGRTDLTGILGVVLTPVLVAAALPAVPVAGQPRAPDLLWVPVPTSARARARRWFDPVADVLRRTALPQGTRVHRGLVRRHRWAARAGSQKTRGLAQRAAAVRGSMRARGVAGRSVVVVDDVVTSGATAGEAVRVLRGAGAHVVAVVVLAAVRAHARRE